MSNRNVIPRVVTTALRARAQQEGYGRGEVNEYIEEANDSEDDPRSATVDERWADFLAYIQATQG